MNCEHCKHFDVRNHRAYCMKRGDVLIPDGYSCPNFESKHQITTTRNPYLDQVYKLDAAWDSWMTHNIMANRKEYNKMFKMDKVKKVIFNPPATIVYWFDGTKTIVKRQKGEIFDKEKGFAMACAKKFFGNKGNYYNEFRKHGADKNVFEEIFVNFDTDAFARVNAVSSETLRKAIIENEKVENAFSHYGDFHYGEKIGKIIRSGIEDGIYKATVELTSDGPITEQHIEVPELDENPVGADSIEFIEKIHKKWVEEPANKAKARHIIKCIREELNDRYWGLKLYVDPETKPDILDMVIFNDSGKSLRFVCNLDEVELEKIDDSVKTIMKNVSECCL